MDNEKIKELSAKLAKKLYNDDKAYNSILWWGNEPKERKAEELELALKFLLETHCIVEKIKIKALYSKMDLDGNHLDSDNDWVVYEAMDELENIFGEAIFNPIEKK